MAKRTARRRPAGSPARRLAARGCPPARLTAAALPLMLPVLVGEVPREAGWLFEVKWDGVRVLLLRAGGRVELRSRNGLEMSARYPEVAAAVARLPGGDLALDGEVVALDAAGRPSFARLQRGAGAALTAYVFDCLVAYGRDVRGLPLVERKALLARIVRGRGVLRYADHVTGQGRAFLEAARTAGLEGVVAKRAAAPYRGGRRPEWLKVKCHRRQEFVIGGYTDPQGSRAHLGALHLGVYDGATLVYAGRVGSGLDGAELAALHVRLRRLAGRRCPFGAGAPPAGRGHHWVRPALVCEVRFTEWTEDGRIRHPVYLGLRPDKAPREVRREG